MFIINPSRFETGSSNGLLTNLSAYWKLDEASGNRSDSHASFTLTDVNGVGSTTGIISNAADFVASGSDYFNRASNDVFTGTGAGSISLWLKHASAATTEAMLYMGTNAGAGQQVSLRLESGVFWARAAGGNTVSWGSGYDDGAWKHALVTWPASATTSDLKLYINGSLVTIASSAGADTLNVQSTNFLVGNDTSNNYWDDQLDEVGIWSRELSSGDSIALYNSGSGLSYDSFD